MAKLAMLLKWLILLPVLLGIVLLALANDQDTIVHLNPFVPEDTVLRAELPLYQLGFLLFVLGALVGALIAWSGQRKYRLRARDRREETSLWQARTEWSERRAGEAAPAGRAAAFLPRPERG